MENDFLHKISIEKLSKDTGLPVEEIAKLAGIAEARNLGKWAQEKPNGSRPNYNAIVRLLQKGATVETLFGVNYAATHQPAPEHVSAVPSPEFLKAHPELLEGMREQLLEMGFVSKDQIEDLIRQTIERKSNDKV